MEGSIRKCEVLKESEYAMERREWKCEAVGSDESGGDDG